MDHSRTPTQNTAGDGFPADPIDGLACGPGELTRAITAICVELCIQVSRTGSALTRCGKRTRGIRGSGSRTPFVAG
jgi:hypothetical protein